MQIEERNLNYLNFKLKDVLTLLYLFVIKRYDLRLNTQYDQ